MEEIEAIRKDMIDDNYVHSLYLRKSRWVSLNSRFRFHHSDHLREVSVHNIYQNQVVGIKV